MTEELIKYIKDGISISKLKNEYLVFTIPTQHFKIKNLSQLTPEYFEMMIIRQLGYENNSKYILEEMCKQIDEEVLKQLNIN
jgi:hypothetical protein